MAFQRLAHFSQCRRLWAAWRRPRCDFLSTPLQPLNGVNTLPPNPLSPLACVRPVVASRSWRLYTAGSERSTFKQGAEYNGSALSEKRLCVPSDGLASVFSPSDISQDLCSLLACTCVHVCVRAGARDLLLITIPSFVPASPLSQPVVQLQTINSWSRKCARPDNGLLNHNFSESLFPPPAPPFIASPLQLHNSALLAFE